MFSSSIALFVFTNVAIEPPSFNSSLYFFIFSWLLTIDNERSSNSCAILFESLVPVNRASTESLISSILCLDFSIALPKALNINPSATPAAIIKPSSFVILANSFPVPANSYRAINLRTTSIAPPSTITNFPTDVVSPFTTFSPIC